MNNYTTLWRVGVETVEARSYVVEHIIIFKNKLFTFFKNFLALLVEIFGKQFVYCFYACFKIVNIYFAIGILGEIFIYIFASIIDGETAGKIAIG